MDFFESIPGALAILGATVLVSLVTLILSPILGPLAPVVFQPGLPPHVPAAGAMAPPANVGTRPS